MGLPTDIESKTRELAEAYVRGTLDPEDWETYEEHMFGCAACRKEVQAVRKLRESVAYAARTGELQPPPAEQHGKWGFGGAAALGLGVLGFLIALLKRF